MRREAAWYRQLEERELGRVVGDAAGSTLVVVAAIHGNEPAGLEAARRVLDVLSPAHLRGELVVLVGNHAAMKQNVRYQARDLNRAWHAESISATRAAKERIEEQREQHELLHAIDAAESRSRGRLHLADLHTSSAPGVPFIMLVNDERHRAFVESFGVPALLGLDAHLQGVLSSYMSSRGWISFAMEGGQHVEPASIDSLEAAIWQCLRMADQLVDDEHDERVRAGRTYLDRVRGELPRLLEVRGRHAIVAEDRFVMEPGFRNIHRAENGQLLARDARGEIRASEDGLVILPLYQGLGQEGFFWGRELVDAKPHREARPEARP